MIKSTRWPLMIALAVALTALGPVMLGKPSDVRDTGRMLKHPSHARSLDAPRVTIDSMQSGVSIRLGDSFLGSIAQADVDFHEARFNAVEGTLVRIHVKALRQSDLLPTLALRDPSGMEMDLGDYLRVTGNPKQVFLDHFPIPTSGNYTIVIGGSFGSGEFVCRTGGRAPRDLAYSALSGFVTNELTGEGIAGAAIWIGPYYLVSNVHGAYGEILPAGAYSATFDATYFVSEIDSVALLPRVHTRHDVVMTPVAPVVVEASIDGTAVPEAELVGHANVVVLDGSTVESVTWIQQSGVMAQLPEAAMDTTIKLGPLSAYKEQLFHVLTEPPIGPEELPPNVPPPPGEFPGGLQDRFQVVGLNPFALEETALLDFEVQVVTTSGTYDEEIEVHTLLPWKPATGNRNVPTEIPVLLHGKTQSEYAWSLTVPEGSTAMLMDATGRNPMFTPDVPGLYVAEVMDESTARSLVQLEVWAGTWRGVVVGQDAEGRPIADGACTGCHSGFAPDEFTPWAQTGHAEIFTNNLNTSSYYGERCFSCHTVGYDPEVVNGGIDNAADYHAFLESGLIGNPGDNWTTMLEEHPLSAQLANIQCENCHGPQSAERGQDSGAHGWNGPAGQPREGLSSDICATCHGEPLRHARFQQWQLSGHANYELAIDEGDSGNCSRCHTANGFLTWLPILNGEEPGDPTASVPVSWTADEVHPQTCVTCHDPHDIGTSSGIPTDATVRISDDTPLLLAGFKSVAVGRGAICMTCHNSRRGLRNDATWPEHVGTSEAARAAHGSAQTDVLMGENAYYVNVGTRGAHSFVSDTCADCHMEKTPPPPGLAYNSGGTNHTFYASNEICSDCHGSLTADGIQNGISAGLDNLQALLEATLLELITELVEAGNVVDLDGDFQITDATQIAAIEFGEARGRQAITVTFLDESVLGPYRMNDVTVIQPDPLPVVQLYDLADESLPKAGWNWTLIHNDSSLGVHNPSYSFSVLGAAEAALEATP